jgi:hypothetical protein
MLALMLDPYYKSFWDVENYVGSGNEICLAFEYDMKVVIPFLMANFERLNFFV